MPEVYQPSWDTQPHSSGEIIPLTPQEQALLEVLTPPDDVLDVWRQQFDEAIKTVTGQQLVPEKQDIIQAVADKIGWEWFGKPGEALPDTLAMYAHSGGGLCLIYRPDLLLNNSADIRLKNQLLDILEPIKQQRKHYFEGKLLEVTSAVEDIIRTGPQYGLLKALMLEKPDTDEQPLTPAWRRVRENQVEQTIRLQHDIAPGVHIPAHSIADRALRKAIYRLDHEAMPRHKDKKQNPSEQVQAWLMSEVQNWLPKQAKERGEHVVSLKPELYTRNDGLVGRDSAMQTNTGESYHAGDSAADWSSSLCAEDYIFSLFAISSFDDFLAHAFVYQLHWDKNADPHDVSGALERAVNEIASDETRGNLIWDHEPSGDLLFDLRRPTGVIYSELPINEKHTLDFELDITEDQIDIADQDSLDWEQRLTAGHVLYRDTYSDMPRLICGQPKRGDYPNKVESFDLLIDFAHSGRYGNERYRSKEPYIPGYEAIAQSNTRWYFARTENDPYTGAGDIQLEAAALSRLAAAYNNLGLGSLAEAITDATELSATDLADLISTHSDYTFDRTLYMAACDSTASKEPFQRFVPYIVDGRLQMQCTGAATFFAESLEMALPGSVCTQVSGRVLTDRDRITEVGHAQTLVTFQGQRYILDATPAALEGLGVTGGYSGMRFTDENHAENSRAGFKNSFSQTAEKSKTAGITAVDLDSLEKVKIEELQAQLTVQNPANTRHRLERLLQATFKVNNSEQLYEGVVRLSTADPVRRTLEAAIKAGGEHGSEQDIHETLEYIRLFKAADATTLRRLGVPKYNEHLLKLMHDALVG